MRHSERRIPASQALRALGIPHRLFYHAGPLRSLEQAAKERGQDPEQVIRSLLFRVEQGQYLLVLVPGLKRVSWPALRHYLEVSRIALASVEEVRKVTGFEIGAVTPFGLPEPLRVIVDAGVLEREEVSLGSGVKGVAVILSTSDLIVGLEKKGLLEIHSFDQQ